MKSLRRKQTTRVTTFRHRQEKKNLPQPIFRFVKYPFLILTSAGLLRLFVYDFGFHQRSQTILPNQPLTSGFVDPQQLKVQEETTENGQQSNVPSLVQRRMPTNASSTSNSNKHCQVAYEIESEYQNPTKQVELLRQSKLSPQNGGFYSQYFQDATLISALGKQFFHQKVISSSSSQNNGNSHHDLLYVDLAAAWPESLSNTVMLDRCYGWKGLCIEGDPWKAQMLRKERSCQIIDTCVTDTLNQQVQFRTTSNSYKTGSNGIVGVASSRGDGTITLNCTTLKHIFHQYQILKVDVMSLDVEGAEAMALGGIDFNQVYIHMIIMEAGRYQTNSEGTFSNESQRVIKAFNDQGYVPVMRFFESRKGMPILQCEAVILYGKPIEQALTPVDSLERWRTADILFIQKESTYLPAVLNWIRAAGCQLSEAKGVVN